MSPGASRSGGIGRCSPSATSDAIAGSRDDAQIVRFQFRRSRLPQYNPGMSEERKRPGVGFWAAVAAIILLVVAYGIAYTRLASPTESLVGVARSNPASYVLRRRMLPAQPFWRAFFAPANAIDRKIRPKMWQG